MKPSLRRAAWRTFVCTAGLIAAALPARARAQDASTAGDADLSAAATVGQSAGSGACQSDAIPSGHEMHVEISTVPVRPSVGDRVMVVYRFFHQRGDHVEFDPDPVAFTHPEDELEYARQQPDRDRQMHTDRSGHLYGEVQVAVQPFKAADITIVPQLARLNAAGDVIRVCTPEARFHVHDPFGNEAHPRPRDVTPPEAVTEDALRWRWAALVLDAIVLIVLATLAISGYLRSRPTPVVPPPPPRPAWIVALEALDAIAGGDMLARGAIKDYYDAVSDVVRRYVGAFRGFDALEMTTDQVLRRIRRTPLPGITPVEIEHLLRECDLVKFARYVPSHEESDAILAQAYTIVRRSSPAPGAATPGAASEPVANNAKVEP